jgi:hypothetical protein
MQTVKNCECTVSGRHASCSGNCNESISARKASLFAQQKPEAQSHHQEQGRRNEEYEDTDSGEEELLDHFRRMIPDPIQSSVNQSQLSKKNRMTTDADLLQKNRASLRKFEALNIGGKSITEMSIGGYKVDLEKVAEKAMEVLPLPPSRLPVIFVDQELNFYHHFFQGINRSLGARQLEEIVKSSRHFDDLQKPLLNCLEELIISGYERTDDEITILLKKVIGGTFETTNRSKRYQASDELLVVANLWGFEYIEQGMQCSEADLRMWLSMCYNHYKTIWFNTFKSTGVPEFAMDGAMKGRSSSSSGSSLFSVKEETPRLIEMETELKTRARSSRRRSSGSVAGSERTVRKNVGNPMTNWLAAKPIH